jgi:transposase-like protein
MRKQTIDPNRRCPKCGKAENQINSGKTQSGSQRCTCKDCNYKYTLNGKTRAIPEEKRKEALRIYYSGVSSRGVGKILGMGKENVLRKNKKNSSSVDKWENKH